MQWQWRHSQFRKVKKNKTQSEVKKISCLVSIGNSFETKKTCSLSFVLHCKLLYVWQKKHLFFNLGLFAIGNIFIHSIDEGKKLTKSKFISVTAFMEGIKTVCVLLKYKNPSRARTKQNPNANSKLLFFNESENAFVYAFSFRIELLIYVQVYFKSYYNFLSTSKPIRFE